MRSRAAAARATSPRALLELARVPGTVTAAANVLAGYWVATAGGPLTPALGAAVASSMLLYGGGVALNDWFDRRLDAEERPLRPIPSGRVAPATALAFGAALLVAGVAVAAAAGVAALGVAAALAVLILGYDAIAKSSAVLGPLNMGVLRGLNFLLGVALVPAALAPFAPVALAHVAFVAAITVVGKGEAYGSKRADAAVALALAVAAYAWLAYLIFPYAGAVDALPFLAAFVILTGGALARVLIDPKPSRVHAAVKTSVLSLVLLDAALAAAAAGLLFGAAVASLAFPAYAIAKAIPVH